MRKAVVVIPTYNEAGNMEQAIKGVFEATEKITNWSVEVLVVDSNSTDNTGDVVKKIQAKNQNVHLMTTKKEGLGKAYIQGFQYALENLKPYLLFEMDADLSHDPKEIPLFLKNIETGSDFVIGSRYIKGGSIPADWGLHRKIFSVLGNYIIRFGFMKLKITDWTGGYRAIKAWIVKDSMSHIQHYSGYVFQIALLDYAVKNNAAISEIPIQFKERTYGISKINSLQYIAHILLYVFTKSSFVKFVIVGGLGFVVDTGLFFVFTKYLHFKVWGANLISTESAVIFNYLMNNYWSFAHKKLAGNAISKIISFVKFNLISSGSIIIQTIGLQLAIFIFHNMHIRLSEPFDIRLLYTKIAIIFFIVIPYSYIFYNKFIWKEKR